MRDKYKVLGQFIIEKFKPLAFVPIDNDIKELGWLLRMNDPFADVSFYINSDVALHGGCEFSEFFDPGRSYYFKDGYETL
jgi:hypothetical protein